MSIKFNARNHPYIDLGDGYQLCFNEDRCTHGERFELETRNSINETPQNMKAGVAELQRLIASDPDLCVPTEDSSYLTVYLRASKYDPQEAFNLIREGFRQRVENGELFTSPATVRHVYDEGLVWVLPERDEDGAVVVVVETGKKWNPATVSLLELNTAVNNVIFVLTKSVEAQLHGYKIIFDTDGLSLSQIMHFTPRSTRISLHIVEKCSPIRLLHTHTINNGLIYQALYAIIKPLLSKRMREVTLIHGKDLAAMAAYISPRILPPRFGGCSKAPAYDGKLLGDLMMHYDEWCQKMNSYGYKREHKERN